MVGAMSLSLLYCLSQHKLEVKYATLTLLESPSNTVAPALSPLARKIWPAIAPCDFAHQLLSTSLSMLHLELIDGTGVRQLAHGDLVHHSA